ncbi:MAG: stage II sporulation protein P [Clostridia bacterium]|nr:stage II sporulation protein P [Clostridia bacterium]
MFNIAVINGKEIVKYFIKISIVILIIVFITKFFSGKKNISEIDTINLFNLSSLTICLDDTVPGLKETNNATKDIDENLLNGNSYLEKFLKVELSMFNFPDDKSDDSSNTVTNIDTALTNDTSNENTTEETVSSSSIQTDIKTEIVTQNPLSDNYNTTYKSIKIKNETDFELTNDILSGSPQISTDNILIFHTHTCESYTQSEAYPYTPTGNFRTTDNNYSVVRVGNELTKYLTDFGYNVIHNTTYHDYPAYTGSYNRSLTTVQNILSTTDCDVIIDLHRDAIGSRSDYAPTVKIGDDYAAQLMFVIGTNGSGLWHPNWAQNLQFAIKVQEKANELYPGLFKPIILRNSRYNQHLGKAACIIEVGSTGNTLEQSITSMKYLSKVLDECF